MAMTIWWGSSGRTWPRLASQLSLLVSDDEWFPTWWMSMPEKLPIITGCAPFRSAEILSTKNCEFVVARSVETLQRLLGTAIEDLQKGIEAAYFHDWQSDPF